MKHLKKFLMILFILLVFVTPCSTNINKIQGVFYNKIKISTITYFNIKSYLKTNFQLTHNMPIKSPLKDVKSVKITSDYGLRFHPIFKRFLPHKGIDLVSKDKIVVSTGYGIVIKTRKAFYGYGNYVLIDHLNGFVTRYAHLGKIYVSENDTVYSGNIIAKYSNTGLTTGPHLHYEIIYNNEFIDPMFFTYSFSHERSIDKYKEFLKNSVKNILVVGYNTSKNEIDNEKIFTEYYLAIQRASGRGNKYMGKKFYR